MIEHLVCRKCRMLVDCDYLQISLGAEDECEQVEYSHHDLKLEKCDCDKLI